MSALYKYALFAVLFAQCAYGNWYDDVQNTIENNVILTDSIIDQARRTGANEIEQLFLGQLQRLQQTIVQPNISGKQVQNELETVRQMAQSMSTPSRALDLAAAIVKMRMIGLASTEAGEELSRLLHDEPALQPYVQGAIEAIADRPPTLLALSKFDDLQPLIRQEQVQMRFIQAIKLLFEVGLFQEGEELVNNAYKSASLITKEQAEALHTALAQQRIEHEKLGLPQTAASTAVPSVASLDRCAEHPRTINGFLDVAITTGTLWLPDKREQRVACQALQRATAHPWTLRSLILAGPPQKQESTTLDIEARIAHSIGGEKTRLANDDAPELIKTLTELYEQYPLCELLQSCQLIEMPPREGMGPAARQDALRRARIAALFGPETGEELSKAHSLDVLHELHRLDIPKMLAMSMYDERSVHAPFARTLQANLRWCPCVSPSLRFASIIQMVRMIQHNHPDKSAPVKLASVGSGALLHEYLLTKLLMLLGYRNITFYLVDPDLVGEVDLINNAIALLTRPHFRVVFKGFYTSINAIGLSPMDNIDGIMIIDAFCDRPWVADGFKLFSRNVGHGGFLYELLYPPTKEATRNNPFYRITIKE